MKKIPARRLGVNGPEVSAVGLGTMGIGAHYGKTDESSAFKALTYAADRGMTLWDCADIYGSGKLFFIFFWIGTLAFINTVQPS